MVSVQTGLGRIFVVKTWSRDNEEVKGLEKVHVKIGMSAELSKCAEGVGKSGAVLWLLIWLREGWVA